MSCSTKLPSVENTLENIYPDGTILDEFTSTYYYDKNNTFGLLFQLYTASASEKHYHLSVVKELKSNMDKAAYEEKIQKGVDVPSEKIELDRNMNVDHWPIWILNEI